MVILEHKLNVRHNTGDKKLRQKISMNGKDLHPKKSDEPSLNEF